MKVYVVAVTMQQNDDPEVPISGWAASTLELAKRRCVEDYLASCHVEQGDDNYEEFVSHVQSDWEEDFAWPTNRKWMSDVDGQLLYTILETDLIERVEDMFKTVAEAAAAA